MCLGTVGRVVTVATRHPHLATVQLDGTDREVNIAMLDAPPAVGDWVLLHLGFAMEIMTAEEAMASLAIFELGPPGAPDDPPPADALA